MENKQKTIVSLSVIVVAIAMITYLVNGKTPTLENSATSDTASPVKTTSLNNPTDESNTTTATNNPPPAPMMGQAAMMPIIQNKKIYTDGSYTAKGVYTSPDGPEDVDITLVIKNNTAMEVTFVGNATHPVSKKLQGMFAGGYHEMVVGKSIDEISLTVVSGSSLTPKGFMDALQKIKTEAKAS